MNITLLRLLLLAGMALGISCSSTTPTREIRVSVADQKMALLENGSVKRVYPVSTSKFGLGDRRGRNETPLGNLVVAKKIGQGAPKGMAFKGRQATGEIVEANAPGRDIITSRILWLAGRESKNSCAFGRCIYIHGTPEEYRIGTPASYGCIRMKNRDVIDLFDRVAPGTPVNISTSGLPLAARFKGEFTPPRAATRPQLAPVVPAAAGPGQPMLAQQQHQPQQPRTTAPARLGPDIGPRGSNTRQKRLR